MERIMKFFTIVKFRTVSLFEDHEVVKIGTFWSHLNLYPFYISEDL
jgi:hypothetical protein